MLDRAAADESKFYLPDTNTSFDLHERISRKTGADSERPPASGPRPHILDRPTASHSSRRPTHLAKRRPGSRSLQTAVFDRHAGRLALAWPAMGRRSRRWRAIR